MTCLALQTSWESQRKGRENPVSRFFTKFQQVQGLPESKSAAPQKCRARAVKEIMEEEEEHTGSEQEDLIQDLELDY